MNQEYKNIFNDFKEGALSMIILALIVVSFCFIVASVALMFGNFIIGAISLFISLILFGGFVNIATKRWE